MNVVSSIITGLTISLVLIAYFIWFTRTQTQKLNKDIDAFYRYCRKAEKDNNIGILSGCGLTKEQHNNRIQKCDDYGFSNTMIFGRAVINIIDFYVEHHKQN